MFSRADPGTLFDKRPSRNLPPKPPLPLKNFSFLPKIKPRSSSRNISNDSSRYKGHEDSFSLLKSNESNDVSYISTNSNSSTALNKKKPAAKEIINKVAVFPRSSSASSHQYTINSNAKPPKDISSKSWVLYNVQSMQLVYGKKHHYPREIASLTKIMTCYVALGLVKKMNLPLTEINIRVSRLAASMIGTSANLKEGDQLKLIDLLYGMMLPSGNDAAFVAAEALGCLIFYDFNNRSKLYDVLHSKLISGSEDVSDPVKHFINEMNKTAKELKMYNTTFSNPHGLMNRYNRSTASDVAKLTCVALKLPLFLQIVNTKLYECVIRNHKYSSNRKEIWFNTNKLLDKGFTGVKTGITDTAGPCLATSLRSHKENKKDLWLVCVILNCRSMEKRWSECENLLNWGIRELKVKDEGFNCNMRVPKGHN